MPEINPILKSLCICADHSRRGSQALWDSMQQKQIPYFPKLTDLIF
jgi:hypothetical protein